MSLETPQRVIFRKRRIKPYPLKSVRLQWKPFSSRY